MLITLEMHVRFAMTGAVAQTNVARYWSRRRPQAGRATVACPQVVNGSQSRGAVPDLQTKSEQDVQCAQAAAWCDIIIIRGHFWFV